MSFLPFLVLLLIGIALFVGATRIVISRNRQIARSTPATGVIVRFEERMGVTRRRLALALRIAARDFSRSVLQD